MMKRISFLIVVLLVLQGCSRTEMGETGARQALDQAAEAMGGWEALRAVSSQRIESTGSDWDPFQANSPDEVRHINDFTSTLVADFQNGAARVEFAATTFYPRDNRISCNEVLHDDLGMLEQGDTDDPARSRMHGTLYATEHRDLRRLPARVLLTASEAEGLTRLPDQSIKGTPYQVLQYRDSGLQVEMFLDASTHLPSRVAYLEDDVRLGDTRNEFVWSDWREAGGLQLPFTMEHRLNGHTFRKEQIQSVENNPSLDAELFAIPDEIRQAEETGERVIAHWVQRRARMGVSYLNYATPQQASLEEVSPGLFLLGGAGHQSYVIEMNDHLVVIEAPLFEERSLAVIAAIQEKFPDKPIRYLVMTHYHRDHSGGFRTYVAEGATIVAPAAIQGFWNEVLSSPRTIEPDAFAQLAQNVEGTPQFSFEGVEEIKELTDGDRVVRLYAVPNPHVQDMIGVYLPAEKATITADLVSSGLNPDSVEERAFAYYDFVQDQGLDVDRILRVHGPPVPFQEFAGLVQRARR